MAEQATSEAKIRQRVQAARTDLILDQPFFGALALRLHVEINETVPTAGTDGTRLIFNPRFVATLSKPELLALIAHEVMHCSNGHPWRRDGRDHHRFNVACDYAINYVLEEAGFKLPSSRLRSAEYDGKSAEWIYARLPKSPQQGGASKGDGAPMAGADDVLDAPQHGAGDGDEHGATYVQTEADWQQAVQQAALQAKMRGNLPAVLERFAKAATEPRVDWRSVLRRFVQAAAKQDYSWRRPSARHLARGLYLPALHSEAMGPIAVAIDTSGSIDDVLLSQFSAEIRSIADEMRPERVYAIYCDAAINRVDTFERDDVIELKPCGGGGTSHVPVMNYVDAMEEPPVCLVCLTDLMTMHRPEPPGMPVLWATTYPQTSVPYGEVLSMER